MADGDTLLTTREVASRIGKHQTTVLRMIGRGVLVPVKKVGQTFLFRADDIEALNTEADR